MIDDINILTISADARELSLRRDLHVHKSLANWSYIPS